MLDYEDILYNSTIMFDFNLPSKMFISRETTPKSKVYFNGIDKDSIKYVREPGQGVVWFNNTLDSSWWQFNVTDFKWREASVVKNSYPPPQLKAVISTALNAIELPVQEFENFCIALKVEHPDFEVTDAAQIISY